MVQRRAGGGVGGSPSKLGEPWSQLGASPSKLGRPRSQLGGPWSRLEGPELAGPAERPGDTAFLACGGTM